MASIFRHMATAPAIDSALLTPDIARVREVEAGLPVSALRSVMADGAVTLADLVGVVGSRRTLDRRLADNGRLSPDESDRLDRFAEVLALTAHVFGGRRKAMDWLRTPKRRLDGAVPLKLVRTHPGTQLVVNLLNQGRFGMLA